MWKRPICALSCLLVLGMAQVTLGELVGHWTLDGVVGGKIIDASGKGNDGTIAAGNPTVVEGVKDAAMEFHGLGLAGGGGDYINCGKGASLDITNKISISMWLRPGADDPEGNVTETAPMAKADSAANPSWSFQVRYGWGSSKPFMAFTFNTTPRAWAYVNKNLTKDEWCNIACSHDGTTLKCYLNGELTDSTPMGAITSSPTNVLIGSDGWGCDWIGAIDDVRMYNHGLTWDEIAEICPPPRIAKNPNPIDGAVGIQAPLLKWEAGYAGVMHEVYFGTTPDLGPANLVQARMPVMMYYHLAGLQPGVTYYWRVDEIEKDGVTVNTGNVWSFTAQDVIAYLPSPADGATDASVAPTLSWQPGQAAIKHHVYFGDNLDAVTQGTAATNKGELEKDVTSFVPGALEPVTTYYWRVDETPATGGLNTGKVWSFTTQLPIDDFESYTDEDGSRIYQTWIDGYTNNTNGSTVGNIDAPFAERTVVHGGLQAMPVDYNNVKTPFFSEAERTFDSAEDWTVGDVNTLVLFVRGRAINSVTPLYVTIEDSAKKSASVIHADPKMVATARWIEWRIPFSEFGGVNMAKVKKLVIGMGDKADPKAGGTGRMYIDDIYAIRP